MTYQLFPVAPAGTYPVFSKKPPSDEFQGAFCDGGSPVRVCDLCNRTHYNNEGEYMREGELDGLRASHEREPARYVAHEHQVGFGSIDGLTVVFDCPCNGMRLFEDFAWDELDKLARYFEARAKCELEEAEANMKDASAVVAVAAS